MFWPPDRTIMAAALSRFAAVLASGIRGSRNGRNSSNQSNRDGFSELVGRFTSDMNAFLASGTHRRDRDFCAVSLVRGRALPLGRERASDASAHLSIGVTMPRAGAPCLKAQPPGAVAEELVPRFRQTRMQLTAEQFVAGYLVSAHAQA